MLDVNIIRENPDLVKESLKKRHQKEKCKWIDELLMVDSDWRKLKGKNDELRRERNKINLDITKAKKAGKSVRVLVANAKDIPRKLALNEKRLVKLKEKMDYYLYRLPNTLHDSVPQGKTENDNVVVRKNGKGLVKKIKSHSDFVEGVYADFDAGRKNSGAGFNYLMGDLAELDLALQRYAVDFLISKGFTLVVPPVMLNYKTLSGVIDVEDFKDVIYKVEGEDLYMIATGEHPLVSLYKGKTLEKLPLKLCCVTPCFRKEIGGHGVDTKGLFRMHQFYKVEQVVFSDPSQSYNILEQMEKITEEFFRKLGIPYRVVEICSGDIGSKQSKQYDIEAWFPRQKKYAEVTSCSNCTDYQSRRLNIRYLKKDNTRSHVHILNNTMCATSRAMVAILENCQTKGCVRIPKVLKPYMRSDVLDGR